MLHALWEKLKEAMISVIPVMIIVLILNFTPLVSISMEEMIVFFISGILVIFGLSLFTLGTEMSMEPMGEAIGGLVVKSKKIPLIIGICFFIGIVVTICEPDITELIEFAQNIKISDLFLGVICAIGVGIALILGSIRILHSKKSSLSLLMMFMYLIAFALSALLLERGKGNIIPFTFDAGQASTGALTIPFIMALGIGAAQTVGGRNAKQHSFGMVALCAIVPVIIVSIMGLFINDSSLKLIVEEEEFEIASTFGEVVEEFGIHFIAMLLQTLLYVGLLFIVFLILNKKIIHLPKAERKKVRIGLLLSGIGMITFLTSASLGFHPIGFKVGQGLAEYNKWLLPVFGFIFGIFLVLSEPAVHTMVHNAENITTGRIKRKTLMIAIAISVGIAMILSCIRIIFGFSILYYLVPGIILAFALSFFTPKLYSAIAFDSSAVSTGPMNMSFMLPFAIGACYTLSPDKVFSDAFGVAAMVALVPLITIQILGFGELISENRKMKKRYKMIVSSDDEQIINF